MFSLNQQLQRFSASNKDRTEMRDQQIEEAKTSKGKKRDNLVQSTQLQTQDDHLPKSIEIQDDMQLNKDEDKKDDRLGEQMTYSQEYYILHREELMQRKKEKEEEAKFGDYSARLVKRPQKNFLWGFGTQVNDESDDYFRPGQLPTIREIIRFLEAYQMKDITVVNLKATGRDTHENYAIVASGFSIKHIYNNAKLLVQKVKELKCPEIVNQLQVSGRRDESWLLVTVKEIQVNFLLHEYREELDLEFRWLNSPPQEMVNKWKLYDKMGRRSGQIQQNDIQQTSSSHTSGGGHQRKPSFFNSKKSSTAPADNNNAHENVVTTTTNQTQNVPVIQKEVVQSQPNQGTRGELSMFKQQQPQQTNNDFMKETSLNKQRLVNSQLPQYNVQDGEFINFPEITNPTIQKLKSKGITSLFPIQMQSFYPIYNREDLIARDLTGSGKTLAFGIPLIEYLRKNRFLGQRKIQAIVLAPTRELALQVQNVFAYLKHSENEFRTLTVYGGVSIDDQTRELRYGVDIFVGTTGRVRDHIERGNIDFSAIKSIILDEADMMLDLGFKDDIEWIMNKIHSQCQNDVQKCLFSATIPRWVKSVAQQYLKPNYRLVDLAQNLKNKTAKLVQHLAINCPPHNKIAALADLLICYGGEGRSIVFTQTKADANSLILSDKIKQDIEVMHGDIAQNQREVTLKRFREGKFHVLVATDVASRGLDIPNVDLVIQVEPPNDVETYIHRSGRTARAGKMGICITFYTKQTQQMIQQIEDQAGIKFKIIGVPQAEDVIKASSKVILKNLELVNSDVIPFFTEAAKQFITQCSGDPEKALCKALAYISGHYKTALQSRSLLSGQEKQITLELRPLEGSWVNSLNTSIQIFKKFFPQQMVDHIKGMRAKANQEGIVFDIYEDQCERFLEISAHLRETDSSIDFEVIKCLELPELESEDSIKWRGGPSNDNRGGYGGKHNRHQSYSFTNNSTFNPASFKPNDNGYGGGQGFQRPQGGGRGGYHSRQPSGSHFGPQSHGMRTQGGSRSYMGSRKSSNVANDWDDKSNSKQDNFDKNSQNLNDFDVKIQTKPPQQQSIKQNFQQNRSQVTGGNSNQPPGNEGRKLYIGNIHYSVKEEDISALFDDYNLQVVKFSLLKDEKGRHKGAGFVEFETANDAEIAVNELDQTPMGNQPISIEYMKTGKR